MKIWKIVGLSLTVLVVLFLLGLYGLGWMKFFEPKKENIRREIFEQTQSYTHAKIQDLAKIHSEYSKADAKGKEALRQMIIMRFAEFDETKIKPQKLRNFLTNTRGY